MGLFKVFCIIWLVGAFSSFFPWLHIGFICGLPAITLNSVILTLLYRELQIHRGEK